MTLLLDYKLVCEYRQVALRPNHLLAAGKTAVEVEEILGALEDSAIPVLVHIKHRPLSQDKDDDMVLDVAINGDADILVTKNIRDFAQAAAFGIRIMTPGDCLAAIRKASDDPEP